MTHEEMKHWLKRGFYAQKRAEVLKDIIANIREQAQNLSRSRTDNAPVSDAGASDRTEQAVEKLAEMESRYVDEQCRLAEVSAEIADAIAMLENDDLQAVLESRYLLLRTAEQTAEALHYDVRTVRYKQKRAVERLCEVWRG